MSRQNCHYSGTKLPDRSTCAALCPGFPTCLPPLSAPFLTQLANLREINRAEDERTTTLHAILGQVREALEGQFSQKDAGEYDEDRG